MTEVRSSPTAHEQLAAIASLSTVLDERAIDFWLFGGWAVDFWVGTITRQHDDIDVVAWRGDYDAIEAALDAVGWRHIRSPEDVVGTRYMLGSAEVEFTFVEPDSEGAIVVPIPGHPVVWTNEPFGNERRELLGVTTRTIPLALLKNGKSLPRESDVEGSKDRADFQALAQIDS